MSKTKASATVDAARGLVTDPDIRRAAAKAAGPMAQLSFGIGKRLARRGQVQQLVGRLSS